MISSEFSPFQGAGRRRNGTVHQLIRVLSDLETRLAEVEFRTNRKGAVTSFAANFIVVALLDCSKAFPRMSRAVLVDKLYEMGVRGRLFDFLIGYFCGRQQRVRVGDSYSEFR